MSSCKYCMHYVPDAKFCKKKHVQLANTFDPNVIHSVPYDCPDFFKVKVIA